MADRDEGEEKNTAAPHIYGDLLEAIISHVSLIDLLPAYHVSRDWRRAVIQSLVNPSRLKPWLIAHIQCSRNPLLSVTLAFDPESQLWIEIPRGGTPAFPCLPVKSSSSNLLYTLSSKLSFSLDALKTKWHEVDGPEVTRLDPIVAVVGSNIVIAGGTHDFEDDPLAVEIYDMKSGRWVMCQSIPDVLKGSAATTWLSVAVSGQKLFLLEKSSGILCVFNSEAKAWEGTFHLKPQESLFFSLIGVSNSQLFLIGLIGDIENVESLRIWEVNCGTFNCTEVGRMPSKMLEELMEWCSSPSSINISMTSDRVYIYGLSYPKEIFFSDLGSDSSSCDWGRLRNSVVNDKNGMRRFAFTCAKVGISDLQKAFGWVH